jgi:hypothetical protein
MGRVDPRQLKVLLDPTPVNGDAVLRQAEAEEDALDETSRRVADELTMGGREVFIDRNIVASLEQGDANAKMRLAAYIVKHQRRVSVPYQAQREAADGLSRAPAGARAAHDRVRRYYGDKLNESPAPLEQARRQLAAFFRRGGRGGLSDKDSLIAADTALSCESDCVIVTFDAGFRELAAWRSNPAMRRLWQQTVAQLPPEVRASVQFPDAVVLAP